VDSGVGFSRGNRDLLGRCSLSDKFDNDSSRSRGAGHSAEVRRQVVSVNNSILTYLKFYTPRRKTPSV